MTQKQTTKGSRSPRSLKEALKKFMTEEELKKAVTSFDIIGDIAIIEIPEELERMEKEIGKALLEVHKNVKTVCKRAGIHKGIFRIRAVEVIAGEKRTETVHTESGVKMKLDVNKVYFSPRLSYERERIAEQVKKGEKICVFFAGVGPYALVIAKKNPNVKIDAIELNPDAFHYLEENIRINRMQSIIRPIFGDVRRVTPDVKYDRILMPLPKGGEAFLDTALEHAGKSCMIHFYSFGPADDSFSEALGKVREAVSRFGRGEKIVVKREIRAYSPGISQIVIDFFVS